MTNPCITCGKEKEKFKKLYCVSCAKKSELHIKSEYQKRYRLAHHVKHYCKECGNEIEFGNGRKKYCCSECFHKNFNRRANERAKLKNRKERKAWLALSDEEQVRRMQEYMLARL